MVRAAGTAPAPGGIDGPAPTWMYLARRGLPSFAVEGIVPVAVFYGVWRLWGLAAGIVAATALSAGVLLWQSRRGQQGPLARMTLVFLGVQALVGLASHSATVYLAQPEFSMQSLVWGVTCLARAGLRLAALLGSGVGGFILVSFVTGTPLFLALVAWGVWHARRTFSRLAEPAPALP